MLYSALGQALIHSLTRSGAVLAVPEVVKLEVCKVIHELADDAVIDTKKNIQFLKQISQQQLSLLVPTDEKIREAIDERWRDLRGLIWPMPFTLDQSRAALSRIIDKTPPCGNNNEQFRDCCIWQCALDLTAVAPVYLISNDYAFYDSGKRGTTIHPALRGELAVLKGEVTIYPSLDDFLNRQTDATTKIDEGPLKDLIIAAVTPNAQQLASGKSRRKSFILGPVKACRITGYSTPKASEIAVAFSARFELIGNDTEAELSVSGSAAYHPASNTISDIEVSEWSQHLKDLNSGVFSSSFSPTQFRDFTDGKFRVL
jgi:hypothetical protein